MVATPPYLTQVRQIMIKIQLNIIYLIPFLRPNIALLRSIIVFCEIHIIPQRNLGYFTRVFVVLLRQHDDQLKLGFPWMEVHILTLATN